MEAGRELDALVAEKVLGWRRWEADDEVTVMGPDVVADGWQLSTRPINKHHEPHYSTDIAAAWQVVEKLRADGWCVEVAARGTWPTVPEYTWDCHIAREFPARELAVTAPLAICLAALRAVGAEVPE